MGGLGSALPKTKWLMWIGTAALIGFFPLSRTRSWRLRWTSTAPWRCACGPAV